LISESGSRKLRYISAAVGIPIGLGVCIFSAIGFGVLATVFIAIGVVEFYAMARHRGFAPHSIIGTSCTVGICALAWFSSDPLNMLYALAAVVIIVFTVAMARNVPDAMINISVTVLGVFYVGWFASHIILLRQMTGGSEVSRFNFAGAGYVIMLLVLLWLSDGGAFFAGTGWGKHKLIPAISPNKTIEGAAGGVLLALIGAAIIKELGLLLKALGISFFPDFSYVLYFLIALGIAVVGLVGDLCESYLKRDAGLKDTGNLFPGHGGFLDRFDSLLMSAPLFYYFLRFVNYR
jgi:phosphatidate cytidylyltransferase